MQPEPRLQPGKYVSALVSKVPKRNGWVIAQRVSDRTLLQARRLLNRAVRDTFAVMRVVRRFAVAGLDETGHALVRASQRTPPSTSMTWRSPWSRDFHLI